MLQTREAFWLASTASLVGVPLWGQQLLTLLAAAGPAGPLAHQIAFNQKVYELQTRQAGQRLEEIEAELQRHQLAIPQRPTDGSSFFHWREAITKAVLDAVPTGTAAALAAFVGLQLGEALLTESLLAMVLALLTVAPDHAALGQKARALAARLEKSAAQLAQLVERPQATPAIRRIGGELVAALNAVPDLSPAAIDAGGAAAVREHQGQIERLRQALAAALLAEVTPELLVPSFLLGYLPTATGIPFQTLDLLAQLERNAPPALLARSGELADRLRAGNRETVDNVLAVEALLHHGKLAVPPRPQTPAEYFTWLTQIRQTVPTTVPPMSRAGGAQLLGFFLADLLVTLKVQIATLALRAAAPEYPPVLAQLAASAKGVGNARQNLDQALRHPALPEPARAIGRRLADQVAQAVTADTALAATARLTALETAAAELQKGQVELIAVLVKAQQTPAKVNHLNTVQVP